VDIRHAVGVRVGLPESKLAARARYRESGEFAPREVAALTFAEQVVRDDQEVSEACWGELRRHFSEAEATRRRGTWSRRATTASSVSCDTPACLAPARRE
jgi:alkylhydroperoxidase family enzyme